MKPLKDLDILVVEDQYFVATELSRILRDLGAGVIGPLAGIPLDTSLANRSIDIALVDVELACGTSFPLIDEMSSRGVPVALITGYGPEVLPRPYRDLPHLDKPVERDKLTAAVLRMAGRTGGMAA